MKGLFNLTSAADLLQKLEHDIDLIREGPGDPYAAFNFFVTAEHMLDWLYPGYENKKPRERLRKSEAVLQICSHLANGAKHFMVQAKHHNSVSNARQRTIYAGGALPRGSFPVGAFPKGAVPGKWSSELFVELTGDAVSVFGEVIHVVALAERVLEFWREHLKSKEAGDTRTT